MKKLLIYLLLLAILVLSACQGSRPFEEFGTFGTMPWNGDSTAEGTPADGEGCGAHTDADADDTCDTCGVSVVVVVDFYAMNDLHGKFDDTDSQPGVDELTAYLKNANTTDDHTVFLSSGDMWQGSSESNMTRGMIITDWMNAMGFVSMTLGNHEFDWGEDAVAENADAAEFSVLAINVYDRETRERVEYAEPSVMIERGNVKIGVIGAVGDCYSSIAPDKVEDVYFKVGSELTTLVKEESTRLREAGADFIVYSLHDGYGDSRSAVSSISDRELSSYYDVALSEGYVDLVFEGHSHQRYTVYDSHGVYHLQNGGENKGISHAEIAINYVNDTSTVSVAEFVPAHTYTSLDGDPLVDSLLDKYADVIDEANRVVGTNDRYLSSDALCDLVAELYYDTGLTRWGEQYDIALGGGFLQARSPYHLPAGEVRYSDLQMIFPFDNQLVLCSIEGRYLSSRFFETGNSSYHIAYGDYGASIRSHIDPYATYYVVVDSYTSSYAPNRLTVVDTYDPGVYARDLLAAHFEASE